MTFPPDPRPPLTPERVREIAEAAGWFRDGSFPFAPTIGSKRDETAETIAVLTLDELDALTLLARAFLSQPEQVQRRVLRRVAYDDAQPAVRAQVEKATAAILAGDYEEVPDDDD